MVDESHDPAGDGGERRARWKRILRWTFRVVAILLLMLLFLLHLLPYLTDTGLVRGLVAEALSDRLNGADVRIGSLRIAPVRGRLALVEDFAIAPPGQPDSPVVSLGRVRVQWRPRALLDGIIRIASVSADEVSVRVRRDEAGWNVLAIIPESEEPLRLEDLRLPLPVVVDAIRARGVRIRAEVPGALDAGIEDLVADGSCRLHGLLEGEGSLVLRAHGVAGRAGPVESELADGFRVAIGYRNTDGVAAIGTTFEAPSLRAASAGLVDFGPVHVRAGFGGELDLQGLELPRADAFVSVPGLLDGRAALSFTGSPDRRVEMESLLLADVGAALSRTGLELPGSPSIEGTVSARTELTGDVRFRPAPGAALRLKNDVVMAGVSGGLHLPETSGGAGGEASGVSVAVTHEAQVHLGNDLGGLTCVDGVAHVSRLEGALGEMATCAGEGLLAGLRAEVTLPHASSAEVGGRLSADVLSARGEAWGRVGVPAEAHFRLGGSGLADPARHPSIRAEAKVRAGDLAPWLWVAGEGDVGSGEMSARGGGVVDVGEAVHAAEGLEEGLRQRIGALRADGGLGGIFRIVGDLPGAEGAGLRCEAQGAAELERMALDREALRAELGTLRSLASLGVSLDSAFRPFDLSAAGSVTLGGLEAAVAGGSAEAAPAAGLDRLEAGLDLRALRSGAAELEARGAAATEGLRLAIARGAEDAQQLGPVSVRAAGELRATPLAGDLTVTDARAQVEELGAVHVPELRLAGLGADGVEGSVRLEAPDLRGVAGLAARSLPPDLADRVPEVAGRTEAEATFSGELPLVDATIAALARGRRPTFRVFPLAEFYRESVPLDVEASLAVHEFAVAGRFGGREMSVRGVDSSAGLRLADGDIGLDARLGIGMIEPGALPVSLEDFTFVAQAEVEDFDALKVREFRLTGPGETLEATGSLSAGGLGSIRGVPTPGELLAGLDVAVDSDASLRLGGLRVLEGLETDGELGLTFSGALEPAEAMTVRAEPRARSISVRFRDLFSVAGVSGSATFSKRWDILRGEPEPAALSRTLVRPPETPPEPGLRAVIADFATAVDELTGPGKELELDSASGLGVRLLESLSVALDARGATVEVPRFYLRPLGGKMVGRMSFAPRPEGRELRLQSEFSNVDFRQMLPPELRRFRGDAQVSGSVTFAAVLTEEAARGGNPLRDVSARVDVTDMGAEALDRLLLALDPKGQNPAFVRLRLALKLASPRKVELRLERGFVSMDVELQGLARGLVSRYSLPRFNVARLFASGPARAAFGRLAPALRLLEVLGAEAVELGPDGSVRFVRRRQKE